MLDQVVSASAAERNWSLYDKIKTQDRNRLGHAKGDKLVYCHEALHLRKKLQKAGYSAGYKAKVEKWRSGTPTPTRTTRATTTRTSWREAAARCSGTAPVVMATGEWAGAGDEGRRITRVPLHCVYSVTAGVVSARA